MKKLQLKNVKVVKLSTEELSNVKGGIGYPTSHICNYASASFVSWCHTCPNPQQQ